MGQTCKVLVERKDKLLSQTLGKSPCLQSVLIDGGKVDDLAEVEIVAAGPTSMHSERAQRAAT